MSSFLFYVDLCIKKKIIDGNLEEACRTRQSRAAYIYVRRSGHRGGQTQTPRRSIHAYNHPSRTHPSIPQAHIQPSRKSHNSRNHHITQPEIHPSSRCKYINSSIHAHAQETGDYPCTGGEDFDDMNTKLAVRDGEMIV